MVSRGKTRTLSEQWFYHEQWSNAYSVMSYAITGNNASLREVKGLNKSNKRKEERRSCTHGKKFISHFHFSLSVRFDQLPMN